MREQLLAAASVAASLLLVVASIAASWVVLWHTTLKDIGLFRDMMGLNRPSPTQLAQRRAAAAAEIERLRRQHSRGSAGRALRAGSGGQLDGSTRQQPAGAASAAVAAAAAAAAAAAPTTEQAAAPELRHRGSTSMRTQVT